MRGHFNDYSTAEVDVYRGYRNAKECNLNHFAFFDTFMDIENALSVLNNLKQSRFYYACPSTRALDELAYLYTRGLKIVDVFKKETLLGEKSYLTACEYVVLIGKRERA